jgi:cis-3-alkyl-4-acyloxetan-2-one decarboxylase
MFQQFWHTKLKRPFRLHETYNVGDLDGKPLLLIHGLASDSELTWVHLVETLDKKQWHIVGYDLLGHGKSPAPEYMKYTVEEHARSLVAVMKKHRKTGKPFTIVGHSMGCLIAAHIAHTNPKLVDHMVLYEPPLFADSSELRSHGRRKKLYFAIFEYLLRRPRLLIRYATFLSMTPRKRTIRLSHHNWHSFEKSLKNTIMRQQAYRELRHTTVKTDIIYGSFDIIATKASIDKMLNHNKNIVFHSVKQPHNVTKRAAKYIERLL